MSRIANRKRDARPVEVPGAEPLHVRDLTLSSLRQIDLRAGLVPEGPGQDVRRVELVALYALADADGTPWFPDRSEEDLADVAELTPAELKAIAEEVMPGKDHAKNG